MFYFWIIAVTVTIAIPLSQNADTTDKTIGFSTFDSFESQPVTAASTDDSECITNTSMNDIRDENGIYRRVERCEYQQTSKQTPGVTVHAPTGPPWPKQEKGCEDHAGRGQLITCGGPEVYHPDPFNAPILAYDVERVFNCLEGGEHTEIPARWKYPKTDVVAQYCCNAFHDAPNWWMADLCARIPSRAKILRMTEEEWNKYKYKWLNIKPPKEINWWGPN